MRIRYIGILLLALLTIWSCDDNTGTLGMGMLPGSDGISAHTTSFDVTTKSVEAGAVYSKTSTGYIGRFTDPHFGYYEASFLSELNCTENLKFPAVYKESADGKSASGFMAGDSIVSMQLVLYYSTWFGDSLNACRMSVYELNDKWLVDRKDPNKDYRYTNIDTEKYINASDLLGRKAYTAYDTSVPDSVRNATDYNNNKTFYPNIIFPLDKKRGNDILKLNREKNGFADAEYFINNIFKGVYIKSDYGDGTILYIDRVDLQMQFRFHHVDATTGLALKKKATDKNGKVGDDSLYYSMATVFASTKEVIQANKFSNSETLKSRVDEKGWTYIKSPAGIFTEATMPYDKIHQELTNDTLNAVKLTFTNYHQKAENKFSMTAPTYLLLIRKGEVKKFFEENQLTDNIVSYVVSHNNIGTNQYTFNNISRLASACINEKNAAKKAAGSGWNETKWKEENPDWDKVWLIPVTVAFDSNSSNPNMINIQNDLKPGYAKLKGGPETSANGEVKTPLKLEVTYTSFSNK